MKVSLGETWQMCKILMVTLGCCSNWYRFYAVMIITELNSENLFVLVLVSKPCGFPQNQEIYRGFKYARQAAGRSWVTSPRCFEYCTTSRVFPNRVGLHQNCQLEGLGAVVSEQYFVLTRTMEEGKGESKTHPQAYIDGLKIETRWEGINR